MTYGIRRLRPEDDRSRFVSGQEELDLFFHRYAGQNQFRHHVGTTYVAIDGDLILGFATVSGAAIEFGNRRLSRGLPQYPLPVLRLARLAVAETAQGLGVGEALLRHVMVLAIEQAERVGCVGIVVDAKPDAAAYYRRYGFAELEVLEGALEERPRPIPMFLPMAAIPRPGTA